MRVFVAGRPGHSPVAEWPPYLAGVAGAKPPLRVPPDSFGCSLESSSWLG
ncbi:hypothetical protein [Allosalinactinospora lopnorensis]|nr:hypothetical protein [Allosalinactinospora lopnorensis]